MQEASSEAASSEAAAQSAPSEAVLTDEEIIQQDFENQIKLLISPEVISAGLIADEEMASLFETINLDVTEYAQLVCDAITMETTGVDVNGDSAVLHVTMTLPDFANGEELMNSKLEEKTADLDIASMSEEEFGAIFADVMRNILSDPDMPTSSTEFDIEYLKKDGAWAMADEGVLNDAVGTITNAQ